MIDNSPEEPKFEIEKIQVISEPRTIFKEFILEEPQIIVVNSDLAIEFSLERELFREAIKEKFNDQVLNDIIERLIFQIEYYEKAWNDSKEVKS